MGTIPDLPQTRWARTVDGASIAYQDLGEGDVTLVLIHGWISHLEIYWEQPRYVRFLRRLSRDMRVLVFDKRGVGMSDRVSGTPDIGMLADDIRAVMDAAGVEKASLFAWGSPGPELAVFFAATHPERTLSLIDCGLLHRRREVDYPWGYSRQEFEERLATVLQGWGTEAGARGFIKAGYLEEFSPQAQIAPLEPYSDPEFVAWNARLARYGATPSSCEAFERMWFDVDVRPLLGAVSVPTAVLACEGDASDEEFCRAEAALIPTARVIKMATTDEVVWVRDPEPVVSAIERFLSVQHERAALDRVLATVLFADIVASTDAASRLGDSRWMELLEQYDRIARTMLDRYRGVVIDEAGDGLLATFDGPARAVWCAQSICQGVRPFGFEVRAGCHTGEIELMGDRVAGIAVHIGARVAALAGPSEVLVSSTVKDLVAGSGLAFEERGEHTLKGVGGSWRLFSVVQ